MSRGIRELAKRKFGNLRRKLSASLMVFAPERDIAARSAALSTFDEGSTAADSSSSDPPQNRQPRNRLLPSDERFEVVTAQVSATLGRLAT
jgi:hypothetical protein